MLKIVPLPYLILGALALIAATYALGHHNGYTDAQDKQEKVDAKAQKRIDAVPAADSATIIKRLQSGSF